jgi:hypothetical protein
MEIARKLAAFDEIPRSVWPRCAADDRRNGKPSVVFAGVLNLTVLVDHHDGTAPDPELALHGAVANRDRQRIVLVATEVGQVWAR